MTNINDIPEVDLKSLKRTIADSTYSVYCSKWRYAAQQFQLTGHSYWQRQMELWEQKITRSGRTLPKMKEVAPSKVQVEVVQEELEPFPGYKQQLKFLEEAVRTNSTFLANEFRKNIVQRGGPIPEHLRQTVDAATDQQIDNILKLAEEPTPSPSTLEVERKLER